MTWVGSTFSERSMKENIMDKVRVERIHDDRRVKRVHKDSGRHSKWTKACKQLVRKYGLNCREDVFGRGHKIGWNVVCMSEESWELEYNEMEESSESESKRTWIEKVEIWYGE